MPSLQQRLLYTAGHEFQALLVTMILWRQYVSLGIDAKPPLTAPACSRGHEIKSNLFAGDSAAAPTCEHELQCQASITSSCIQCRAYSAGDEFKSILFATTVLQQQAERMGCDDTPPLDAPAHSAGHGFKSNLFAATVLQQQSERKGCDNTPQLEAPACSAGHGFKSATCMSHGNAAVSGCISEGITHLRQFACPTVHAKKQWLDTVHVHVHAYNNLCGLACKFDRHLQQRQFKYTQWSMLLRAADLMPTAVALT